MPRLPVGQHEVKNWPVLDLGEQPTVDKTTWKLEIGGLVENPFTLDWDAFLRAAAGRGRQRFPLRHDLEPLRQPLARSAVQDDRRTGHPERRGAVSSCAPATTSCPAPSCRTPRTCRSHARSKTTCCWCTRGKANRCRANMAGPCRMITPKLYAWKGTKWIRKIEFLAKTIGKASGKCAAIRTPRSRGSTTGLTE